MASTIFRHARRSAARVRHADKERLKRSNSVILAELHSTDAVGEVNSVVRFGLMTDMIILTLGAYRQILVDRALVCMRARLAEAIGEVRMTDAVE